jgi:hypothetical protein
MSDPRTQLDQRFAEPGASALMWHDGALHFSTGTQEQKALNLATNPAVALSTGTDEWDRGVDIVVEVHAVRPETAFAFGKAPAARTTYRFG